MKTKLICWFDNKVLEHCKDFLIENQIMPICADAGIAFEISKRILLNGTKQRFLWEYSFENTYPNQCYLDEILSVPNDDKGNKRVWEVKDNIIYGETSTETISQLVDAGCKSITLTVYGWHLFRIFGLNIRMPFTSQLRTWIALEKKYGNERYGYFWACDHPIDTLFSFVWIMLDQDRHWKKLLEWCLAHNKIIGLIAPDSKKNNPEWVKEQLTKFIKVYNEVTE